MISQNSGNSVVLLQAFPFGHEFAEGLFLFAFQNGERTEDIGEFVAGESIKMGHIGVDLSAELGSVTGVPPVWKTIMHAAVWAPFECQILGLVPQSSANFLLVGRAVSVDWGRGWVPEFRGLPVG